MPLNDNNIPSRTPAEWERDRAKHLGDFDASRAQDGDGCRVYFPDEPGRLPIVRRPFERSPCPRCGSQETRTYSTRAVPAIREVVRYIHCFGCNKSFREETTGVPMS